MKKAMKVSVSLLVVVMAFSTFCFGQESAKLTRSKTLSFGDESEKAEVKINVASEYNYMRISIKSDLHKGEVVIELYDPKGKKQGNFTVKTDSGVTKGKNTAYTETVTGSMVKRFRSPAKGDWMVKVLPKKAQGRVLINSMQVYEPKADLLEIEEIEKIDKTEKIK